MSVKTDILDVTHLSSSRSTSTWSEFMLWGSVNLAIKKACPCGNERQPPTPSKCLEWQSSATSEKKSLEAFAVAVNSKRNKKKECENIDGYGQLRLNIFIDQWIMIETVQGLLESTLKWKNTVFSSVILSGRQGAFQKGRYKITQFGI